MDNIEYKCFTLVAVQIGEEHQVWWSITINNTHIDFGGLFEKIDAAKRLCDWFLTIPMYKKEYNIWFNKEMKELLEEQ